MSKRSKEESVRKAYKVVKSCVITIFALLIALDASMFGYIVFGLDVGTGTFGDYTEEIKVDESKPTYKDYEYEIDEAETADGKTYQYITLLKYTGQETEITVPWKIDGIPVSFINNECFSGNTTLEKLTFKGNIKEIGNYAFYKNTSLKEIHFYDDDNSLKIGSFAFRDCTALESVEFYNKKIDIGIGAFFGDISLKDMSFIESCKLTIRSCAFKNTHLSSDILPEDTTNVGNNFFVTPSWRSTHYTTTTQRNSSKKTTASSESKSEDDTSVTEVLTDDTSLTNETSESEVTESITEEETTRRSFFERVFDFDIF